MVIKRKELLKILDIKDSSWQPIELSLDDRNGLCILTINDDEILFDSDKINQSEACKIFKKRNSWRTYGKRKKK